MLLYSLTESALVQLLEAATLADGTGLNIYPDHRETERKLPCVVVGVARPASGSGRLTQKGIYQLTVVLTIAHAVADPVTARPDDHAGIADHQDSPAPSPESRARTSSARGITGGR